MCIWVCPTLAGEVIDVHDYKSSLKQLQSMDQNMATTGITALYILWKMGLRRAGDRWSWFLSVPRKRRKRHPRGLGVGTKTRHGAELA